MSLALPVVWSDLHQRHDPGGEVWVGVHTQGTEVAARVERIRAALSAGGAPIVPADPQPESALLRVHDPALLDYLATAWADWERSGLREDPGQGRVVPYLFPHPGLLGGLPVALPNAAAARAGLFAYDTMTLIGPGTWEAVRAAADVAITAADLVAAGAPAAYACCRPPGHHATRSAFGGSCYLNNAALAAAHLQARTGGRVAVVDIDAHHGNGTQAIFYEQETVLTGSVHVDPAAGWFPHLLGFAAETGSGPGAGTNLNLPLAPGSDDRAWLAAVERIATWAAGADLAAVVVALGVDAAAGDPEGPFAVSASGFERAGELLGDLGLPVVAVQEGGYELDRIGTLVATFLGGLERAG